MRRALAALLLLLCSGCRSREASNSGWTVYPPLTVGTAAAQTSPVLATLPEFHLIDQHGAAFGLEQMRGSPWIANFVFTRCPSICPTFTSQMASLEKEAAQKKIAVRFVSFSVDPGHDTPEVLTAWAKEHAVDWTLLTGTVDQIQSTVVGGLKIAAKPIGPDDDLASVFHGTHFVLIDASGHIRGYYDSSDEARVAAILPDAAKL
jgi:protein SCO1/2